MKYFYTWLLISLGLSIPLSSQTLINWPLSTSQLGYPTVVANGVTGITFARGNGLGILNYTGSGVSTHSWAISATDEARVDYYEFGIIAQPNQTIEVDELNFSERRSSSGPQKFVVTYSKDGFLSKTTLSVVNLPDNIFTRSHAFIVNEKIADGEELRFRLFAFNSESPSGSWTLSRDRLVLKGQTMASCIAPVIPSSIQISNLGTNGFDAIISGGSGHGRLIVLGPEQADFPSPYQGNDYMGNTTYGLGDCLSGETHVITSTTTSTSTISIDGLEEGGAYQLAVFEYDLNGMCYNTEPTIIDISTSCSTQPKEVQSVRFTSQDSQISIDWQGPNCFDKYLMLASEQPIVGSPIGISFDDDYQFGQGSPANGFSNHVYPVFYTGNQNDVTVKGLDNGTTYYFALYTRIGTQWSTALRFESTPEEACSQQNLERIFINEFHYINSVVSQDQGVEIAGPAGIDLSNYELMLQVSAGGNGNTHIPIYTAQLNGLIDDEGAGFGALWFPMPDISQTRGVILLINSITGDIVDFVRYDPVLGIRDAFTHPSGALFNPYLYYSQLAETSLDDAGYSLQRTGEGNCPFNYLWYKIPHSRGNLNVGQLILPVQLTLLAAEAKGEAARVYWQTAQEENSDNFLIEHSTDGRNFVQIGTVQAAGFSENLVDYQFLDYTPAKGINYYRLKQQDFDGVIYHHGIVTVNFDGTTRETLSVFPNPVDKYASINWEGKAESLQLSDTQGRLLRTIILDEYQDGGSRSMDLSNLPHGVYFLRLERRDGIESFTVIKR